MQDKKNPTITWFPEILLCATILVTFKVGMFQVNNALPFTRRIKKIRKKSPFTFRVQNMTWLLPPLADLSF